MRTMLPWPVDPSDYFLLASLLLFLLLLLGRRKHRLQLPPGPRPLPLIGNLHVLGQSPHRSLHELSQRYGPLMFLRLGSVPVIVVSSPAAAKLILQAHDQTFACRQQPAVAMILSGCKGILFSQPGSYLRLIRELCVSRLLSSKRLEAFKPLIAEEVRSLLRTVADCGGHLALRRELYRTSANIISRMTIGKALEEASSLSALLVEGGEILSIFNVGDYMPWLAWMDLQGCKRKSEALKPKLESVWQRIIDDRRSAKCGAPGEELDFLDVLLEVSERDDGKQITDAHMRAVLQDVFAAGIDTSSVSAEWALAELLANPPIMKKVQDEVDQVVGAGRLVGESDIEQLPYLRAVVKETLRLHPVIPLLVPHVAGHKLCIQGFDIPCQTAAFINVWAIGRDPQHWDRPLQFYPDRFIDNDTDFRGKHFQLLPFGAGRRSCPGWVLGFNNVCLLLASLVQAFSWTTLKTPNLAEKFGLIMTLEEPLEAKPVLKIPKELLRDA